MASGPEGPAPLLTDRHGVASTPTRPSLISLSRAAGRLWPLIGQPFPAKKLKSGKRPNLSPFCRLMR